MLTFERLRNRNAERCRETAEGIAGLRVSKLALDMSLAANRAWEFCRHIEQGEAVNPDFVLRELAKVVSDADKLAIVLAGHLEDAVVEEFNRKSAEIGSPIRL